MNLVNGTFQRDSGHRPSVRPSSCQQHETLYTQLPELSFSPFSYSTRPGLSRHSLRKIVVLSFCGSRARSRHRSASEALGRLGLATQNAIHETTISTTPDLFRSSTTLSSIISSGIPSSRSGSRSGYERFFPYQETRSGDAQRECHVSGPQDAREAGASKVPILNNDCGRRPQEAIGNFQSLCRRRVQEDVC